MSGVTSEAIQIASPIRGKNIASPRPTCRQRNLGATVRKLRIGRRSTRAATARNAIAAA
jgi:hypothetical protein